MLQGPPRHGALPAGRRRRPRAQDGRDAHRAHGGQHGRTRRGRASAARLRRAGTRLQPYWFSHLGNAQINSDYSCSGRLHHLRLIS